MLNYYVTIVSKSQMGAYYYVFDLLVNMVVNNMAVDLSVSLCSHCTLRENNSYTKYYLPSISQYTRKLNLDSFLLKTRYKRCILSKMYN